MLRRRLAFTWLLVVAAQGCAARDPVPPYVDEPASGSDRDPPAHEEPSIEPPTEPSTAPRAAPGATCTKSAKRYGTLGAWECIASNAPSGAGLVVALHGYTQPVEQSGAALPWGFKPTSQWDLLGEKYEFHVLYPDKGTQAFSWYANSDTSMTGVGRNDLEPSSLASMVKDFVAAHDVDPARVFINGLSAGAYMTVVMLATYPDVFAGGSTFAGGAYGCTISCAALGKKGAGWIWPGEHSADLVTGAFPAVWSDPSARKPRLLAFHGDADDLVTLENLADLTQQWNGALGIAGPGTTSNLKGHELTEYTKDGKVMVATVRMAAIGHGTPVDPGTAPDQGGWDPEPSQTPKSGFGALQDWTNSAGIYGPYYSAKFWGLVP